MKKFFNYIKQIESTSGTNDKKLILMRFLDDFPIVEKVFYYTYNPYLNFGVRNLTLKGRGEKFLDNKVFKLLEDLNKRIYTGNEAREKLLEMENYLDSQS